MSLSTRSAAPDPPPSAGAGGAYLWSGNSLLRHPVVARGLAGAAGGLLAFLFLEPIRQAEGWSEGPLSAYGNPFQPGFALGALLTALLVFADEWRTGSASRTVVRVLGGAILGGLCGVGYAIWAYWMWGVGMWLNLAPDPWTRELLSRGTAWAVFGLGAGLSAGIASNGGRRAYQGLAGGIVGGFLGGVLFQWLNWNHVDPAFRLLLGFMALGSGVGIGTALLERFTRQAWLVYLTGSREGRELTLARESVTLGRSELVEIPLFGDGAVERRHAVISLSPHPHISEVGNTVLMEVDGYPAREASLGDGSIIRIGRHRLRFHCRAELLAGPTYRPPSSEVFEHLLTPAHEQEREAPLQFPITGERKETGYGDATAYLQRLHEASGPAHGGLALRILGLSQRWVPLTGAVVTVGRDTSATLPLPDPRASRLHAQIEPVEGAWVLRDLDSTNGTRLNGLRITRAGLAPGDRIEVGDTVLVVEGEASPGAAAPGAGGGVPLVAELSPVSPPGFPRGVA